MVVVVHYKFVESTDAAAVASNRALSQQLLQDKRYVFKVCP
jgi:hypothetical protein